MITSPRRFILSAAWCNDRAALEVDEEPAQVSACRMRRQVAPELLVEAGKPYSVLLPDHQVREGGCKRRPVFQLGDVVPGGIAHREAGIKHDRGAEIGLLFVLLDVVPVCLSVNFPIDEPDRISWHVLPVFRELDAEPVVRAPVESGDEPLDHEPGTQLHVCEPRDDVGVQELKG
jgi:hypothetical protein